MVPKDYIIEDGHLYYRKKPLYQQALFWTTLIGGILSVLFGLLALLFFLAFLGNGGGAGMNGSASDYYESYQSPEDVSTYRQFALEEKASFDDQRIITVQSLAVDKELELVDDDADQALVVRLQVENPSDEIIYFEETDFYLMDDQGEESFYLDLRTYDENIPEKVDPGTKIEVTLVYAVDEAAGYALFYGDAVWQTTVSETL